MSDSTTEISQILFQKAKGLHEKPRYLIPFTRIPASDALLNDIEHYPHYFVLGCIMDRQIVAEKAWNIPHIVSEYSGGREFSSFLTLTQEDVNEIFRERRLHRFNQQMAFYFYRALRIIHSNYDDNASHIWKKDYPDCKEVIRRFSNFPGVGQKISTMATNILVRDFKVPLKNTSELDISVDSQVEKVFKRIGFVSPTASKEQIIEAARSIYPKYPGLADSLVWEIGRDWCKTDLSGCKKCYLNKFCPKNAISSEDIPKKIRVRSGNNKLDLQKISRKFRPKFEELLQLYGTIIPKEYQMNFTSSKTNAILKSTQFPKGVHYEFDDWGDKISVELNLDTSLLPHLKTLFRELSTYQFNNLPTANLKIQGKWMRIQFFFSDTTPSSFIAEAMNNLIKYTHTSIYLQK